MEVEEYVEDVTTVKMGLVNVPTALAAKLGSLVEQTVQPNLTADHVRVLSVVFILHVTCHIVFSRSDNYLVVRSVVPSLTISPDLVFTFLPASQIAQLTENVLPHHDKGYLDLSDLNITPVSMDRVAFEFLHRFRPGGHFTIVKGYH